MNFHDNNDNNDNSNEGARNQNSVFQQSVLAGKRKYFFDVRQTRDGDYYLTMTERKKRYQSANGTFEHERHTIFLYKEDINKFMDALNASVDKIKNELLPDYDYDQFSRKHEDQ